MERTGATPISCSSPKDRDCEHRRPQPVSPGLGPSRFCAASLSYVNDACAVIVEDAIGADPPDLERRVDRRTACLLQADAFREKAIADPEHHDQWIDEAVRWLELAREASCRAVITVESEDACRLPEPAIRATRLHG